jgi:hypothetical protein
VLRPRAYVPLRRRDVPPQPGLVPLGRPGVVGVGEVVVLQRELVPFRSQSGELLSTRNNPGLISPAVAFALGVGSD